MSDFSGTWVVYEYTIETPSVEEIYSIRLDYSAENNRFTTYVFKTISDGEVEMVSLNKNGVYIQEDKKIEYLTDNDETQSKINTRIFFKSENLFKGFIYDSSDFTTLTSILVGLRKSNIPEETCTLKGTWNVEEKKVDNTNVCKANIDIRLLNNSFQGFHSNFSVEGEYYNFSKLNDQDGINEEFGGEKKYELKGETYSNALSCIIKFGDFNVCGYSMKGVDLNNLEGVWFNFYDDGICVGKRTEILS